MIADVQQPDVAEVVLLAREGDRDAFRPLVERYKNAVSAVALSIVRDVAQSHDIAQEAFVEAWSNLPRLREPKSFGPWLLQITRRRALQSLRSDSRKRARDTGWQAVAPLLAADVETLAREHETHQELYTALEALPDDARELLILFYREGHSTKRVAALLELSDAAVRKRLERAREALREKAEQFGALALASAPPFAFASQVQRRIALQARPPLVRAHAGMLVAFALGFALAGLVLWQHLEFEAESEAIRLHANDLVQRDSDPSRNGDAKEIEAPAKSVPEDRAPDGGKSAAADPTPLKSPAQASDRAAPIQLYAPTPLLPAAVVVIDLEQVVKRCKECSRVEMRLANFEHVKATRAEGLKADPGRYRDDAEAARQVHADTSMEAALRIVDQALIHREDAAIHAIMHAHGALIVLDKKHALAPLLDVSEEVARLIDSSAALMTPRFSQTKQPLSLSVIDVQAVARHLFREQEILRARVEETRARIEQTSAGAAGLIVDADAVERASSSCDATDAMEDVLDLHGHPLLPQAASARVGVVSINRALLAEALLDHADGAATDRELPAHAPVKRAEIERRLRELLDTIAARRQLAVVFKREAILDNDAEVIDVTQELLRSYDDAYGPAPLQLPDLSARLSVADANPAQLANALSEPSRRTIDLRNCAPAEHIFLAVPRTRVRDLFDAVAEQLNLAWSEEGAFIRARCLGENNSRAVVLEQTQLDFASARLIPEKRRGECVGIRLGSIQVRGPWSKRGVLDGDLLTEVRGLSVCAGSSWVDALAYAAPGELVVVRSGQTLHL